jgi:hypothetical protein
LLSRSEQRKPIRILRFCATNGHRRESSPPHAAALLTDFYLSKEARDILAQKPGYWTVRKEVRWLQESPGELHIVPQLEWGRKYNQLVENFRKIIGP